MEECWQDHFHQMSYLPAGSQGKRLIAKLKNVKSQFWRVSMIKTKQSHSVKGRPTETHHGVDASSQRKTWPSPPALSRLKRPRNATPTQE